MELIQFLISLFTSEDGLNALSQILQLFLGNSSSPPSSEQDDKEIDELFNSIVNEQKNSPIESIGEGFALAPVSRIADGEIIYRLTRYFGRV